MVRYQHNHCRKNLSKVTNLMTFHVDSLYYTVQIAWFKMPYTIFHEERLNPKHNLRLIIKEGNILYLAYFRIIIYNRVVLHYDTNLIFAQCVWLFNHLRDYMAFVLMMHQRRTTSNSLALR